MLLTKCKNTAQNLVQTYRVRVPHRAPAIGRETVSGKINRIDIPGAQRVTFFENAGTFIDHHEKAPLDDFFSRNVASWNSRLFGRGLDQCVDFGIGNRFSIVAVPIPARSAFLPQPAQMVELFQDERNTLSRLFKMFIFLADSPGEIEATHILDRENS